MRFETALEELKLKGNFRELKNTIQDGRYIHVDGKKLLNLASNDYLGVCADDKLKERFLTKKLPPFSSASARLLSGNGTQYTKLELTMSQMWGKEALVFASGYHMNVGIIPAVVGSKTLILADKLVHASLIDGIRLSGAKFYRFSHNDLAHLEELIKKHGDNYEEILVVVESIYSMDGDEVDVARLVKLKRTYKKVLLYVDEAHGVGVRGENGLGVCEPHIDEIDFLVGTFGKALGSVGGYLISSKVIKEFVINHARSFIFSTALAPLNVAWSRFVLENLHQKQRNDLNQISSYLREKLVKKGFFMPSTSHIVPIILGSNEEALALSKKLQQSGFYAPAIRPPTVKEPRVRISLNSQVTKDEVDALVELL